MHNPALDHTYSHVHVRCPCALKPRNAQKQVLHTYCSHMFVKVTIYHVYYIVSFARSKVNSQFALIKFLQVPGISPRPFRVSFLTLVFGNGLPLDLGTVPSRGRREPTSYKDADLWSIFPNVCLRYSFTRNQKASKSWKSIF